MNLFFSNSFTTALVVVGVVLLFLCIAQFFINTLAGFYREAKDFTCRHTFVETAFVVIVLCVAPYCHGATVIWDAFQLYYGGDGAYGLQYSGYAHTPAMGFQLTHEFDWDRVHAVVPDNQTLNEGNPYAYWIVANAGDLVTMANVLEKEAIFDLAFTSGEWKTSDFWADKGQTFYLALLSGRENTLYCWISMYVDEFGSFSLLHSAISDEPGIIVGQLPEPEPAGGTLAVIGFAVLMLRKRHKGGLLS